MNIKVRTLTPSRKIMSRRKSIEYDLKNLGWETDSLTQYRKITKILYIKILLRGHLWNKEKDSDLLHQ
jgi:hypothetical protein